MLSFLGKIFGGHKKRYDVQKKKLLSANPAARAVLAGAEDTHPEILYYLARDADANIRKAVAVNKSTPVQASTLLANDASVDVRLALAARLVELLPGLSVDKHSQLYAYAVQALGMLAQDEVLKIRVALSSAIKDCACAPPQVAGQLAKDVERGVSEPILRFCVALSDDDLLDILSEHPEPWVISAVASRPHINENVSGAIISTKDIPGNTVLLDNASAKISKDALQEIIARARDCPPWHAPLAARKELSLDLALQLAGFVNESILSLLEKRTDFEPAVRSEIADIVQRRIAYSNHQTPNETPEGKLARYLKTNTLGPEVIHDALAWQDREFVVLALAHLSRIHPVIAGKMLKSSSAKPVIALCWQAKMPMRLAVELQRDFARLQPKDMIYARGGTDYPLTPEDIKWQLEFFGVESGK
jgi:hypothetical protein